jgi:hypothetical protein
MHVTYFTSEVLTTLHQARVDRLTAQVRRRRRLAEPTPRHPRMEDQMDTQTALARFEAAIATQVAASGDPALESAAQALLAALGPATRQLALELAEQAAAEVGAQMPDHEVDVVLREGEPALAVREPRVAETPRDEDYEARITLRLPPSLKSVVEESAGTTGDSVNSWVIKALSSATGRQGRPGRHYRGRVQT